MADYTTTYVEGLVQGYIADFLNCKTALLALVTSNIPTTSNQAQALLNNQYALETQLTQMLLLIEQIKIGNYQYTDLVTLVAFGAALKNQIDNTNSLYRSGSGSIPSVLQQYLPYIVVGIGVIAGAYVILKK